MKLRKIILLVIGMIVLSSVMADTDVEVTLGVTGYEIPITLSVSLNPPIISDIDICDGTCANYKALDPATAFTLQIEMSDGDNDLNYESIYIEIYQTADSNGDSTDWEHIVLDYDDISYQNGDGCTQGSDVNCVLISTDDWTTKFLAGGADIYVRIDDDTVSRTSLEETYSASTQGILVNDYVGTSADSTTSTYSVIPDTSGNAILTDQTNAYVVTTHEGNVDIDSTLTCDDFTSGGDTITVENQKHYSSNDYGSSVACSKSPNTLQSTWGRGTYPTPATYNRYFWLDVPDQQAPGNYTSTLTFGSVGS